MFEFIKRALQGAATGFLHVFGDNLVVATSLIQADARAQEHMLPLLGFETHQHIAVAEHAAAHLGLVIFKGEVPVAGGGNGDVGKLALYPQ